MGQHEYDKLIKYYFLLFFVFEKTGRKEENIFEKLEKMLENSKEFAIYTEISVYS